MDDPYATSDGVTFILIVGRKLSILRIGNVLTLQQWFGAARLRAQV